MSVCFCVHTCARVYVCVAVSEPSGPEAGPGPDPPPGSRSVEGAGFAEVEPQEPATPLGDEMKEEEVEEEEEEDTFADTSDICLGEVLKENQSIWTASTI